MLKIFLNTLLTAILLTNLQIAFASSFENQFKNLAKKFQQLPQESLPQEAENNGNFEGKCECEDSDFVNYEKDKLINFSLFSNFIRIGDEKIFSDFSRSPSSPPPDFFIS